MKREGNRVHIDRLASPSGEWFKNITRNKLDSLKLEWAIGDREGCKEKNKHRKQELEHKNIALNLRVTNQNCKEQYSAKVLDEKETSKSNNKDTDSIRKGKRDEELVPMKDG
ncbi:unnamed protein product [Dovyalis caffra]|uniref:Uncharacterized protein n=1 Tax=Dovyalis caffra TaxID=77055 RepID=A0AAV1SD93_9ROSI|nr:unnamed protein product [Dovyalis caffra]